MIKEIFNYYSRISRKRKAELFFDLLKPQKESILLDAGGGLGTGFRDIWLYFSRVIVVDINKEYIKQINNDKSLNNVIGIVGDVRHLPLEDNSVDYVFSNAVIEHINKRERELFANEIRRVAKIGYFITTPNFWFPFEPHYLCPFFQYLPEKIKRFIKEKISLGHYPKGKYEKIELLTKSELKCLFPTAKIFGLKVASFIPETLICYEKFTID